MSDVTILDNNKIWTDTYPPQSIKEHITQKGFFCKFIPYIWNITEEE